MVPVILAIAEKKLFFVENLIYVALIFFYLFLVLSIFFPIVQASCRYCFNWACPLYVQQNVSVFNSYNEL